MAERRMFSKRICSSARFLKMPQTTQNLYFHLSLNADDDGVVEAYSVMRSIGATEDDIKILSAKQFIVVLNEDLVSFITDWNENNKLRADRKVDSIYKNLLLQIVPDAVLLEKKPRADRNDTTTKEAWDTHGTSHGQPMDGIGKDRLGKVSIGKDNIVSMVPYAGDGYHPLDEDMDEDAIRGLGEVTYEEPYCEASPAGNNTAPPYPPHSSRHGDTASEYKNKKEKSEPDFESFKIVYSELCPLLPKCLVINQSRKKLIKAFEKHFNLEDFRSICKAVNASSWHTGGNNSSWKADFDWIVNPKNATRILEQLVPVASQQSKQVYVTDFSQTLKDGDTL